MSSQIQYVLDTTILEDYFFAINPNSKNWLRNIVNSGDGEIIITPVILIELIRRLYYIRHRDAKKVRHSIKILTHVLKQITIPTISVNDVKDISRKISSLPLIPDCHVGELSLLPFIDQPNSIVVSSDNGVLTTYKNTIRIDPRHNPPHVIQKGNEFSATEK